LTIRNSKLTLTNRLHIDWSATVPCNTACVVVGKNYRLQNIQLSKISWEPGPQACIATIVARQSVNVGLAGSPLASAFAALQQLRRDRQRSQPPRRRCARDSRASFAHRNFSKIQNSPARLRATARNLR